MSNRFIPTSCEAYKFSNDAWDADAVGSLARGIARQGPQEKRAALVIGSGGLPYILRWLGGSVIYVNDLHPDVLDTTRRRVGMLSGYDGWDSYHAAVESRLCKGESDQDKYRRERQRAAASGLQGDFAETQQAATTAELRLIQGDIRKCARRIGRQALREGRQFGLINFTNVAALLPSAWMIRDGLEEMQCEVLDVLSPPSDCVIIDSSNSSYNVKPRVTVPALYVANC